MGFSSRAQKACQLLAFTCVLAAFIAPARSQVSQREGFAGTWVLVPQLDQGHRTIRSAFDRVLRNANGLIRAIARERLDIDQMLPRRVRIDLRGSTITTTVQTNTRVRWQTRERYPAQVQTEDGGDAQLTQLFRGGRLELAFEFPEGRRWIVFSRDGEDQLTMATTVDPLMIDDNVHFSLPFRRSR